MMYVGMALQLQSALTTNPMIMKFAPQDKLADWLGYNNSIETATGQFGPMLYAAIYEAFVAGDKANALKVGMTYAEYVAAGQQEAGRNIMLLAAGISLISTLMAIPTAIWFPPEMDKSKAIAPGTNIDDYEIPEDGEVSNVPAAVMDQINEKRKILCPFSVVNLVLQK